ncbi:MAG: GAF domain-containing protein [Opitutales bacterium]|nr:GAF domain-containing protein [Opitutales bacterium]
MAQPRTDHSLLDALYRISQLTQKTENPKDALETIIDEMIRLIPSDSAAIELINPDTLKLEIEVSRGFPEGKNPPQLELGQGVTGWVALHGKPLIIPDVREDPRYVSIKKGIRSEMAVPLLGDDGHIIGAANIDSTEPDAFTEAHLKILSLLTQEASRVINRIWHIRQLKQKATHLETLITIGQSIVIKRDLDEILQTITKEALSIIQGALCALFLHDAVKGSLSLKAMTGLTEPFAYEEQLSLSDSAIGTAIRRHKMIEVNDLRRTEEHHFIPIIRKEGLVSMLACPIQYENEVIGVLNIYTNKSHRFNNEEKRLFETLASLGAAAIQNARLYKRVFETEENLRQNDRLTTLGMLSAEIAHEIRNPLTVIRLLFQTLSLDFESDDPRNRDAEVIEEKLDQLEEIVSRVLHFSKARHDLRRRFDFNALIEDTLVLVRPKLRQSKVEICFKPYTEHQPWVEVSKGQIQQVLLNLVINSTQAMPEGGRIELKTEQRTIEKTPCIVFSIQDTGKGIPEAIQDKIFDSFLSGRHDGTGLGLSIVKRILKAHHGDIYVDESSPTGTRIVFWLPLPAGK